MRNILIVFAVAAPLLITACGKSPEQKDREEALKLIQQMEQRKEQDKRNLEEFNKKHPIPKESN